MRPWWGPTAWGGVILFARNIVSPVQVWEFNYRLRRAAAEAGRPPLFVMVDQEGGSVARLAAPFTHGPDLAQLGSGSRSQLRDHGRRMGEELAAAGFNWNLAPVLDVHATCGGVMARRSLGKEPERVAELGTAYIQGMQDAGCLACAKHFPGLGRTTADTHHQRPRVELSRDELKAMELRPFVAAAKAGVAGIMVCHAVFTALDPDHPASLSPLVIQGVLRQELGYTGCVLSDDLEMGALAADMQPAQAAVAAYLAGCDLLLICRRSSLALEALDQLCRLADAGQITEQRIEQSVARLRALKSGLSPLPPDLSRLQDALNMA